MVSAAFDLPFTGVYFNTELFMFDFDDTTITDIKYGIGYESKLRFGLEAGLRSQTVDMQDFDEFVSDIEIEGAYMALTLHI